MIQKIALVVIVTVVSSCATSYQPSGFSGGYKETKLNQDTYEISVGGNGYTGQQRVRDIALLRASELTLKEGGDRFVILSRETGSSYGGATPVVANRVGNSVFVSGGEAIIRPTGNLVIRILRGQSDPAWSSALDARLIDAQLRPKLT